VTSWLGTISGVPKKRPAQLVRVLNLLKRTHPDIEDPEVAIGEKAVVVDGVIVVNPQSLVRSDGVVKIREPQVLRGGWKLGGALDHFAISVADRVGLDLGASSGGFTSVLVKRGARTVYAVDVGYGQLLGSLRQNRTVVSLEKTNLAQLTATLVPDIVDVVTVDLSYLSITDAIGQIEEVRFAADADLIALVKPMFELGLGELPTEQSDFDEAIARATEGVQRLPWTVLGWMPSPVTGSHGATEFLLHARRCGTIA
jgi:23S rRNA (cytidine1920-2'-O)/16S rRNA (cytidine1409-2'-O)-methyltransferase